jgi:MFS-type transporter involved in bile tolerance (Atg22 family)
LTAACSDLATVPYNAMLRQLSTGETSGRISGLGSAAGYGGSVLLLLIIYFLGDPATPDTGIVELVVLDGVDDPPLQPAGPRHGFFLLSVQRQVDSTLAALASLGFTDGVRRITMPAPAGKTVPMAVVTAPDGVVVELIGPPA